MGHRHASRRCHVMLQVAFPGRCTQSEGIRTAGCSIGQSWGTEPVQKGPLPAHNDAAGSNQGQTTGSPHVNANSPFRDAVGVSSTSPHCYKLQLSPPVSRLSRTLQTSTFSMQAKSSTAQADIPIPNGIPESKPDTSFMLDASVKNINEILSHQDWESALTQLNLHLSPQLVCEVIKRQTNVNTALSFFQWAKTQQGFQHSGRSYKAMLQKLMSHQDFKSRNLDTFSLIMKESLHNGWSPGVTIHTYLIDGYCKLSKVDEAFDHFFEMVSHGCAPNVVTYTTLLGGLMKVGRTEVALNLLDEMEEKKCYPNVVTYSILIHGLIKHHQLDEASKVFDRMKKRGCAPNLITYSSLIDGAVREGKFEDVSKLLVEMRETGCLPTLFIYGTAINYFAKAGKLQQAWDLFTEMKRNRIEPNLFVYTPLMTSLGKSGNWKKAQEVLKEMRSRGCEPDRIAYSALIAGLVRAGKWKEGMKVVDQMEENGCNPNEVTYTILIDGLVKAKQGDMAQALFKKMVAKGCTSPIYTQDGLGKALERIRSQ